MRRYESGAAKRKKRTAEKNEITKLTKLHSFFQTAESSSSSTYQGSDTSATVHDISRLDPIQTDDLEQAASVTVLIETVTGTGGSAHHDIGDGGEEVLSNSPATADTSTAAHNRNTENVNGFDLGKLHHYEFRIPQSARDEAIRLGISRHPKHFPVDKTGANFPVTVLQHTNRNGESYIRDYLSWSEQLQALFCFPCRLLSTSDNVAKSLLASPGGWSANCGPKWKKLYER